MVNGLHKAAGEELLTCVGSLEGGASLEDGAVSVDRRAKRFGRSSLACRSAARDVHQHCLSQLLPSHLVDHPPTTP